MDIGTLIGTILRDYGLPTLFVVIMFLILRSSFRERRATIEAEIEREKIRAKADEVEGNQQQTLLELVANSIAAFNKLSDTLILIDGRVNARTEAEVSHKMSVDKLVEQYEAQMAAHASERETFKQTVEALPLKVTNGVKQELLAMESRLANIETAVQNMDDSQLKLDVDAIKTSLKKFEERYEAAQTGEQPAVKPEPTTPDTPPTAAEGGA